MHSTSHPKILRIRAAAITLALSLSLVTLSTVTALADANPANHGHHYGQLKHHPQPPPKPVPTPAPKPAPTPAPTSHPGTPGVATGHGSGSTGSHESQPGIVIGQVPSRSSGGGTEHPQVSIRAVAGAPQPFPWVVEGLLPALLLIWFLLLAAAIRRRRREPQESA